MGAYIGENNKARKIKGAYIGVDGVARKIKKAYIGVNGVAYEVGFAPAMVILTIAEDMRVYGTYTSLHIRYTTPDGVEGMLETNENGTYKILKGSYEFPIGTTIRIESEYMDSRIYQYLYLNGMRVAESDNYYSYEYTLTTNTVIKETERSYRYTRIDINEADKMRTVTIDVDGDGSYAWLDIDGSEYYENQTLELPAGTVIKCCIYKSGNVYINGEIYAGGNGEWEYTVTKNCTINLYDHTDGGDIYITEQ